MEKNPYFFPFEIIDKNNLVPGENYYMKLNDNIIKMYVDRRRNIPVSDIKGTFVGFYIEKYSNFEIEYAIFKNIFIMNKSYKPGSCTMMLVSYPDLKGVSSNSCDSYSNKSKNRIINENREVFLRVDRWKFGIPTEQKFISKKALNIVSLLLPKNMTNEVNQFRGKQKPVKGGKK
jgi:hypothetical protein